MWLLLFLNMFADCDIKVNKFEKVMDYVVIQDIFKSWIVSGDIVLDDQAHLNTLIKVHMKWDKKKKLYNYLGFVVVGNRIYSCKLKYSPLEAEDFEDLFNTCVCDNKEYKIIKSGW